MILWRSMAVLTPLCIGRRTDHIPFCVYVILFPYCVKWCDVRPLARPLAFSMAGGWVFLINFWGLWSLAMKSLHVSGRTCVSRYDALLYGRYQLACIV
jgi:hypothetical protein